MGAASKPGLGIDILKLQSQIQELIQLIRVYRPGYPSLAPELKSPSQTPRQAELRLAASVHEVLANAKADLVAAGRSDMKAVRENVHREVDAFFDGK